ncbi:DUF3810 domain-containing protein [Xanthomarina sp. F2636L]|uniref:DUF3810 domain-containing protein n=1 Tax=Xanthomarina sp. F2636L TaxID=2996018 RepID=UPI00225DD560|nr:DUF3810 domain-containing protein [Xanthomarina sp. F2636L]MCX7550012.1 DUF3810 domain-containing protein [Xanthomarina sp. F2636L]
MLKNPKPYIAFSIIPLFLIVKLLKQFPGVVETYYSLGIYPIISSFFRFTLGWIPFSFGDLVYGFAIIYIIRWLILNRRRVIKDTKYWLIDVFAAVSIIYFAFHLFWAMNYHRMPLHKNLNLEADYSNEQLISVTKKLIEKSNALHLKLVKNDTLKIDLPYSKNEIISLIPKGYKALEEEFPHLEYHPKSIKKSLFSLPLTYMGFSGYLNPLTNEAQINGLIVSYRFPVVGSHEVAHQLGYAKENEANFIGGLAAINHPDVYFNYSGYTFLLKHCLLEIYKRDTNLYFETLKTLNKGVLKNYQEVQDFWDRYQNPAEPLFKSTYNSYLIANNQKDGMKSYSYVVALIVNYFETNHVK